MCVQLFIVQLHTFIHLFTRSLVDTRPGEHSMAFQCVQIGIFSTVNTYSLSFFWWIDVYEITSKHYRFQINGIMATSAGVASVAALATIIAHQGK